MVDPFASAADNFFGVQYDMDPIRWSKDVLGTHLWSKQRDIVESVVRNRYTAVRSCHDAGKSRVAAETVSWWINNKPIGEAFAVTTAPTAAQVSAILWREIEKLHRKGNLVGRISLGGAPEWKIDKELVAYGRKPSDYDQDAFQGIHARYILIVVDEACGIPKQLWDAVDSLATNENARVLAIGNPDDASSHFFTVCKPSSGWNVIELDGLQTPNFTEQEVARVSALEGNGNLKQFMEEHYVPYSTEEIPAVLRESLLSPQWVAERMYRWGVVREFDEDLGEERWKTSALWEAKVRGRFSEDSTDGVIPLGWLVAANRRWEEQKGTDPFGRRVYSCDVARFGDDETAICARQGHYVMGIKRIGKQDTMTTANELHRLLDHPRSYSIVDVIGLGAGVVDRLHELGRECLPFNAAKRTDMRDRSGEFTFPNVRSASWWNLREMLDPAYNPTLCIPPIDQLQADLTAPRWRVVTGGKIMVETKEEIFSRIKRSPDMGDALVMSVWDFEQEAESFRSEDMSAEYGGVSEFARRFGDDSDLSPLHTG